MKLLFCKVIWRKRFLLQFFWGLVLAKWSIPCCLRRLHTFLLRRNLMTFTLLLTAVLVLFNKTEYTINNHEIFSFILSESISLLNCFFLWYLLSGSGTMIILSKRSFNAFVLIVILLWKLVIDVLVWIILCILYQVWSFHFLL